MSQADELLNSMLSRTVNPETEPHIVIGPDRFITVPDELKRIAVQYDHDIETVTFDCPRYWDGHDMSQMRVYINYKRPDKTVEFYRANNVRVNDADETIMHFDWTITRNVTQDKGNLIFLVCIKKSDDEDNEINHWNSELNTEMYISEGLEAQNESIYELYPDYLASLEKEYETVLGALKDELLAAKDNGEFDGCSPTVSVTKVSGGHDILVTDVSGTKSFNVVDGIDGVSPVITPTDIFGGTRVTIVDVNGTKTFDVLDGVDGTSPTVTTEVMEDGSKVTFTDVGGETSFVVKNGVDGMSPKIVVTDIDGGHQVTIQDVYGSASINLKHGVDGTSPIISVYDIVGGHRVSITDTTGTNTFDLTDGVDGITPTIDISEITDGHRITITDVNGSKTFDVMNGKIEIEGSEIIDEYMKTFFTIGDTEPTSGPALWFDTSK